MARFEGNNPDYAAGLVLNMREVDEGGPVLSPCSADWRAGQSRRQTELLVLVHGFNNHRREAQDAYLGFRALQKQRLDAAYTSGFEDMLGDGFWPGDANFTGPLDLVDFLVYPATVARAKQTAVVLAGYLATQRADVVSLSFVGHSMGCRVILETIKLLLPVPGYRDRIAKVCLMAAAVPTRAVFPGGDLADALGAARQVEVLHSSDDLVLNLAFPIGQTLAGDGFFPEAIGRHGNIPASPGHVDRHRVADAGHSDYWGWNGSAASAAAADLVSQLLAVGVTCRRLPDVVLPARSAAPERAGPAPRVVGRC